jgi:hypothetical protein
VELNQSAPGGPISFQKIQSTNDVNEKGAVTDLNGDGLPDFAFNDYFDAFSVVQVTASPGNQPGFRLFRKYGEDGNMANRNTVLEGIDLDNDQRTDVLLAASNFTTLRVFRNTGYGASQASQCPLGSYQLKAPAGKTTYQWEMSVQGGAFAPLANNTDFDGVATHLLTVKRSDLTGAGYRYRCVVDGIPQRVYTIQPEAIFTGAVDDKWSNPLNWQCQVLPNEHTVVVAERDMLIDMPATVKALRVLSGVKIRLSSGIQFSVKSTNSN